MKIYTHSLILSHQDVATHYANCVTTGIFFKLNIPVKQQEWFYRDFRKKIINKHWHNQLFSFHYFSKNSKKEKGCMKSKLNFFLSKSVLILSNDWVFRPILNSIAFNSGEFLRLTFFVEVKQQIFDHLKVKKYKSVGPYWLLIWRVSPSPLILEKKLCGFKDFLVYTFSEVSLE